MAEDLRTSDGTKEEKYELLLPQVKALVTGEKDLVANLANICAALKQSFGFLWVGFYIVKENELVLGPFQGPVACTRIHRGKGVCGSAWDRSETLLVPNVDEFPGHIACSSLSKSEIVVPIISSGTVVAVLDVDSEDYAAFNEADRFYLNQLCSWIAGFF